MSILHHLVSERSVMAEAHRGRGRVCRRGRGVDTKEDEPPNLRRDQQDREITARRRRIRELERQLAEARMATANEEGEEESASLGSSSTGNDDEGFNQWGIPNQRNRQPGLKPDISYQTLGMKIDLPEFEGISHPDEFIDWLRTVERVFEVKNLNDSQKVKLVAIKLRKHASIWWEHVKTRRAREGKPKIRSWSKMKKKLIAKFLPTQYRQEAFVEYHNVKQRGMSVEQYTSEFDILRTRCDVVEEDVAPVYDDYGDYDEGLEDHLTESEEIMCADSGESSVLEFLAGTSLPRGQGICTRVPLVMRLQNDPNITAPHLQLEYNNKSLPVEEVGIVEAVIPATDEIAGHVVVQGQPEDLSTVDFPTCESIRMSQQVDKTGERTVAVVNFSARCNVPGLVSDLIKCGKMKEISNVEKQSSALLKYECKFAAGSMDDLYKGSFHDQEVVTKILKAECLSEDVQRGFAQEIYIWRKVRHKNVVQFVGACTKPPCLCIILEFMSGGSMYDFLHHGHLKVYQWSASDWDEVSDILETYGQNCWYPMVCGSYSICTNDGQCNCTVEGNFFRPINRNPDLGYSQLASISCNSSQYHSLIELTDTTYFAFETKFCTSSNMWFEGTKMEDCKVACLSNCSCKAAVWSGTLKKNCLLLNEVFSLMDNWSGSDKTKVFLKVQNSVKSRYQSPIIPRRKQSRPLKVIVASALAGIVGILLSIRAWFALCKKRTLPIKAGDVLDLAPILPGVLTRFSYNKLKVITEDFVGKLWDYLERVVIKVLMYRCENYPQLQSSTKRAVQNLITKTRGSNAGLYQPLPVPMAPWEDIDLNSVLELPRAHRNKDSVMVVVDRFSKMARFKTFDASQAVHLFCRKLSGCMVMPRSVLHTSSRCIHMSSIYDTLGAGAVEYIICHAEVSFAFAEETKISEVLKAFPKAGKFLKGLVSFGKVTQEQKDMAGHFDLKLYSWDEFLLLGMQEKFDKQSGTTGDPKGVMISNESILSLISGVNHHMEAMGEEFTDKDVYLSYLPLAHIFDRVIEELFISKGASIGFWHKDVKQLIDDTSSFQGLQCS